MLRSAPFRKWPRLTAIGAGTIALLAAIGGATGNLTIIVSSLENAYDRLSINTVELNLRDVRIISADSNARSRLLWQKNLIELLVEVVAEKKGRDAQIVLLKSWRRAKAIWRGKTIPKRPLSTLPEVPHTSFSDFISTQVQTSTKSLAFACSVIV
jgi:hypothetical protein